MDLRPRQLINPSTYKELYSVIIIIIITSHITCVEYKDALSDMTGGNLSQQPMRTRTPCIHSPQWTRNKYSLLTTYTDHCTCDALQQMMIAVTGAITFNLKQNRLH